MTILTKIKTSLAEKLNHFLGQNTIQPQDFTYPPQPEMGDLSLPCFALAKQLGKNPAEVASQLAAEAVNNPYVRTSRVIGPYLNLVLDKTLIISELFSQIKTEGDQFGFCLEPQNQRIMVEYSNVNTHKEYHIGHLRNLFYGDAVQRMLSASGYQVIPVSYINDFGIHVAKTLWAYLEYYQGEALPKNKGAFLGKVYVRASQELERDKNKQQLVNFLMKKIESRQGDEFRLWQKTRQWSIEQFNQIYRDLGIKFSHVFYESEFIEEGRQMIKELLLRRILSESEGAIVANLEKYGLGVLVFQRSDGTTLYPVADLPLARTKIEKYNLDISIYVVDVRQSLYFRQLFKVLELLGYRQKMVHLAYDFVKLPEGMMSSRRGRVITYEELKDELLKKARQETQRRHPDWTQEAIEEVAWKLAKGALKFELLKVGADQVITFDINQALRFDGFTAAYLQYAYARMQSILAKVNQQELQNLVPEFEVLSEPAEEELIMYIAQFPEAIE
ncbi:arginine--tRNA ligase, partial [Candidatus Parcubacteria bacterium]